MKKYFWSGNTNIANGGNQQRWGVAEVDDDVDPYDLYISHLFQKYQIQQIDFANETDYY